MRFLLVHLGFCLSQLALRRLIYCYHLYIVSRCACRKLTPRADTYTMQIKVCDLCAVPVALLHLADWDAGAFVLELVFCLSHHVQ